MLFNLESAQQTTFIQDPTHIGTKLRNRLLKPSILLPMGLKQVSISHLKILINKVSKDCHGLVSSDIIPTDKQNFLSFQKITGRRVIDALNENVIDSEATIMYLKIGKYITSSMMDSDLKPLERIRRAWYSVYFIRAWKKWILNTQTENSSQYSIKENFITQNAFECIEINAYGLLHLIIKLREANKPHQFIPTLFNSQTCESAFRQFRSMTSTNWTKINFSLLELLHLVGRFELQTEIAHFKLPDVIFPRIQTQKSNYTIYELPNNEEMQTVLKQCQENALLDASSLGMHVKEDDINKCDVRKGVLFDRRNQHLDNSDDETEEINEKILIKTTNFRDYSQSNTSFDSSSRFIEMHEEDGTVKTILKSSLVWCLSDSKKKLSSDRLKRVQESSIANSNKRKSSIENSNTLKRMKNQNDLFSSQELMIGDWSFFCSTESHRSETSNTKKMLAENFHKIVFGSISGFKYTEGKSSREKEYTLDSARVLANTSESSMNTNREIEVFATWYTFDENLMLYPVESKNIHFGVNIKYYIATMCPPIILDKTMAEKKLKIRGNYNEIRTKLIDMYEQ